MWSAQKDGKIYIEKNPLRLLGLITLLKEYSPEEATEDFTEEDFDILNNDGEQFFFVSNFVHIFL